jgi:ribose transport system substrate-binding protein
MRRLGFLIFVCVLIVTGAFGVLAQDDAPTVAVITPYLAQPGTQFMVEAFQAAGEEMGWTVNVIDTAGDVAAVVSRLEDVSAQGVDAIVINVDPTQVSAGLQAAADAGIPVFGMDAGVDPLLVTNVTSNGYAMAAETSTYVVDRINGAGRVVMFVFDPYPPVQKRGIVADAIFANYPDIEVIDRITPDVNDGGIADSRARMEAVLEAKNQVVSQRCGRRGINRRLARCKPLKRLAARMKAS